MKKICVVVGLFFLPAILFAQKDDLYINCGASDANNDIVNYKWMIMPGSPRGATLETPNNLSTWVRGMRTGQYKFRLIVTDKTNLKDTLDVPYYWKRMR